MTIEEQAQDFWSNKTGKQQDFAHWRGVGRWEKDHAWRAIGERHVLMLLDSLRKFGLDRPSKETSRMLEWGTGGGANVVAFLEHFREIVGVDISMPTLVECRKEAEKVRAGAFRPYPITVGNPEAVQGTGPYDFFLTTAVIQHMPTRDWVRRCLSLVLGEMRPGGVGVVQFRTHRRVGDRQVAERYNDNVARWCLYNVDEFLDVIKGVGWEVLRDLGDGGDGPGYHYLFVRAPEVAAE